ncbi:MAG: diacylglycerol/lipid kinase family protein [Verrucomicrobiales bacterium]
MPALNYHAGAEIPIIVNPAARSTRAAGVIDRIGALSPHVRICQTAGGGDARRLARELAEAGASVVVAAGGDGTMNEVVNGLATAEAAQRPALGLLPTGTMNVLARELELPTGSLAACWEIIESGRAREIDLWRAGDVFFAQLAGIGLDAEVICRTTWAAKRRLGPFSYLPRLVTALGREAPPFSIILDGGPPLTGTAMLVGNGAFYGGPVRAFPNARNDDGRLDILVIHRHAAAELCTLLIDILDGLTHESSAYTRLQAKNLRLESTAPVPFQVDGEFVGHLPMTIERAAFPLRVLC